MKAIKAIIFSLIIILISACTSNNTFFSIDSPFGPHFAAIIGNTIKIYRVGLYSVNELPDSEFVLPDGYKSVFGFRGDIAVVIDDKVKLYRKDNDNWVELPDSGFVLPDGYKSAFEFYGGFGVIIDDNVKNYAKGKDNWVELSKF